MSVAAGPTAVVDEVHARRRWGRANKLQPRCDTKEVVTQAETAQHRPSRWRSRQQDAPAAGEADCPTQEVLVEGDDIRSASASVADPIAVLLARRLQDIVVAPVDAVPAGRADASLQGSPGAEAVAAATKGLFPQSRLASPWQLMLEDGLARDCEGVVLGGGAHHLRGNLCEFDDLRLFEALRAELGRGLGAWNRGTTGKALRKWSIPGKNGQGCNRDVEDLLGQKLPAFTFVLRSLCERFNAECLTWWANLYENGYADRSFHHDCSAGDRGRNITIGGSFGAMRNLTFRHTGDRRRTFDFCQWNGDVFAFRENVNSAFEHGVFPATEDVGPRISVIIMGRTTESKGRR